MGTFVRLQQAHLRPGVRQLAATIQAHFVANLVQRERTRLVAVKASKQDLKAGKHHRVLPSRIGRIYGRIVEPIGSSTALRSDSLNFLRIRIKYRDGMRPAMPQSLQIDSRAVLADRIRDHR